VRPFKGVDAARERFLTVGECERLINACDSDFRDLVRAGLETGARYGELARLVCGDFNSDTGTVFVRTSKTGHPRHIVLTPEGTAFFRALVVGRRSDEIMLRKPSGESWKPSDQKRPINAACTRAGIAPAISFHILRHTYCSLAVMAGMPLKVIAENVGHRSTEMIERHYGHLSSSYRNEQVHKAAPRFNVESSNVRPLR
jgi:integrase